MNNKTILLLGGYGAVGRSIAHLLLKQTSADIIIAGRRKEKADEFAAMLQGEFLGRRITSRYADAAQPESLLHAFQGVHFVVVLTTTPNLIKQIGHAALVSKCDYMDILVNESTLRDLEELAPSIRQQKRTFITQAGFHPGLPAVFVRQGAQYFDVYEKATIAMAMNARFERPEQAMEIISMISEFKSEIFKDGAWREATYKDAITVDLGSRFGTMKLYPMQMKEMKLAQTMFNLKETGVYVSGFNWFVDYFVMPVIMLAETIRKGFATAQLLKLFTWGVNTFSSPHQGVVFLNDAEGIKNGKKIKVRIVAEYDDAYLFTAIPIVACVKQYLTGKLPPGLWMMGHVVDNKILLADMEKMGIKIRTEIDGIEERI